MKRCILAIAAVFAVLCTAKPAEAALLDHKTLGYEFLFPDGHTVYFNTSFTVDPGVELASLYPIADPWATLNVSDGNVLVQHLRAEPWSPAVFNGFRIFDIDGTIDPFSSVTINPATNMVGFDASRIIFDADNIYVNLQGLDHNEETIVSLDITGRSLPEPASLLLFGAGAVGTVARMRRRRHHR